MSNVVFIVCGFVLGIVLAFAFFIKRIWDLEDKLNESEELLDEAIKLIRSERSEKKKCKNNESRSTYADLYEKW